MGQIFSGYDSQIANFVHAMQPEEVERLKTHLRNLMTQETQKLYHRDKDMEYVVKDTKFEQLMSTYHENVPVIGFYGDWVIEFITNNNYYGLRATLMRRIDNSRKVFSMGLDGTYEMDYRLSSDHYVSPDMRPITLQQGFKILHQMGY